MLSAAAEASSLTWYGGALCCAKEWLIPVLGNTAYGLPAGQQKKGKNVGSPVLATLRYQ